MKTKFIILVLLDITMSFAGFAQEKSKAILVDEFNKVTCDDMLARADNFFFQLHANPSAQGYFVISGRNELLRTKLRWEGEFNAVVANRMPDRHRLTEVRGPETGDFNIQFWLVPPGAVVPDFNPTIWNFSLPIGTNPFIINAEFSEMCQAFVSQSVILGFLNSNPGMRVHVVIYANTVRSRKKGRKIAGKSLDILPANRIRYFFVKAPVGYFGPILEYWLVPKKK